MSQFVENFKPETATEMMLLNRIRELERKLQITTFMPATEKFDPIKVSSIEPLNKITIPYTASVLSSVDDTGRMVIENIVHFKSNPKTFGRRYFVTPEPMDKYQAERYVTYLHKEHMYALAKFLSEDK
jgi:hypothetical protein